MCKHDSRRPFVKFGHFNWIPLCAMIDYLFEIIEKMWHADEDKEENFEIILSY